MFNKDQSINHQSINEELLVKKYVQLGLVEGGASSHSFGATG